MAFSVTARNQALDGITVDRVSLHSGDPGTTGANLIAGGGKLAATFNAAASGERVLNAVRDIAGWTFALGLKRHRHDASPLHTMDWTITSAVNGTVRTTLANEISATLEGEYAYSLWRTDEGYAACQARGTITFEL